jgi:ATP-dependent DNA helicase RecQ
LLVRVFTLRFNPATERFDDSAVEGFLAGKEALSIHDHFFTQNGVPYLTLVIRYRTAALPAPADTARAAPQRDESWRDLLEEADWPLFNTLRAWRSERAKQEGIPPYVICHNRQLAQALKARPATLSELGEIEGFGEGKLKQYGQDLLTLIAGEAPKRAKEGDAPT